MNIGQNHPLINIKGNINFYVNLIDSTVVKLFYIKQINLKLEKYKAN